uniref:Uncharacterized protein n=1 Tax=Avena sativa TaxID=4498 RepID=A0ACD6A3D8_AVESA
MKNKGGRIFLGFMVKEEKEENRGSVKFQVFSFTNKIRRLASHLELHKKRFFIRKRSTNTFGKTSTFASLFGKEK